MKQGSLMHRMLMYLSLAFIVVVSFILFDFFSLNVTGNSITHIAFQEDMHFPQLFTYFILLFTIGVVIIELTRWRIEQSKQVDVKALIAAEQDTFYTKE